MMLSPPCSIVRVVFFGYKALNIDTDHYEQTVPMQFLFYLIGEYSPKSLGCCPADRLQISVWHFFMPLVSLMPPQTYKVFSTFVIGLCHWFILCTIQFIWFNYTLIVTKAYSALEGENEPWLLKFLDLYFY